MTQQEWRKFGEIQYIRGRLDEMIKIDNFAKFLKYRVNKKKFYYLSANNNKLRDQGFC